MAGGGDVSVCNGYNAQVITKSVFPQLGVSPPSAEWHLGPDGNLLRRVSDEPGMNINRPANRTRVRIGGRSRRDLRRGAAMKFNKATYLEKNRLYAELRVPLSLHGSYSILHLHKSH